MHRWTKLIHYALICQGFSDNEGRLRLESSERTMKSLVSAHAFLRRIFEFPQWIEEPIADEEDEEFRAFLECITPRHIVGNYDKHLNHIVINDNGKLIPLDLTLRTKTEKTIQNGDIVHVFAHEGDRDLVADMIVSDQTYQMTRYYAGDWERMHAVEDFLDLQKPYQKVIRWMMSSAENTKSVLMFLAHVASFCAVGQDCSSDESLRKAVDQFNRTVAPEHGWAELSAYDVYHIFNVMGIQGDLVSQQRYDAWASDYFLRFLVVTAIVNNISPWSGSGKSIAQVLIEHIPSLKVEIVSSYLPHLCDNETYYGIMQEVLECSRYQSYAITNAEDFLFEALTVAPFDNAFVAKACDVLFEQSIADCQVTDMNRMMAGPNSQVVMDHVFARFQSSFAKGEASHHFAVAAIINAKAHAQGLNVLEDAVLQALSNNQEEVLLGITRVSLLVWTPTIGRDELKLNHEYASEDFVNLLLRLLKNYDARFYTAAASAIHDLIIIGWLGTDVISDEQIYRTAVCTLTKVHGRGWAEKLLALMPLDSTREIPKYVSKTEIYGQYKNRLESELRAKEHEANAEVTFGVLANTGFWSGREWEMSVQLGRVEKYYSMHSRYMDQAQIRRLRILKENIQ